MKRIITNPLAVITLICAMAATAAAQTPKPAPIDTTIIGPSGETKIRTPDGGVVVVVPGKGGFNRIYRTSVLCKTTSDGWGKSCYNGSHTCATLSSDMIYCCGEGGVVSSASCDAIID
jgi:hypothetical protein